MALKQLSDFPTYNNLFINCLNPNDCDEEFYEMSLFRNKKNYEYILNNTHFNSNNSVTVTNIFRMIRDIYKKYNFCFLYKDEHSFLNINDDPELMTFIYDCEKYEFISSFSKSYGDDYFHIKIYNKENNVLVKKFTNYHASCYSNSCGGIEEFLFKFGESISVLISELILIKQIKKTIQKENEKILSEHILKKYLVEDLKNNILQFL